MKIPFNKSPVMPKSEEYMLEALNSNKLSGGGAFTQRCSKWMETQFDVRRVLLTPSCSHALDMAAKLCSLEPGDEVIMPSYTFSSTANAFVGVGAKIVFIDLRPDTMNMDENLIEDAITSRTRVIVPMHYAGVACEMDKINALAEKYNLKVVEDAAQGVMASYKGRPLGTLSDFGGFSFHETKNFSMGEGGALLLHGTKDGEMAEIMQEKGTDRSKFFRGQVDKYSWRSWGSSYVASELNAAYLWSQLESAEEINNNRLTTWHLYRELLAPLKKEGLIEYQHIPEHCVHPAHMFFFKAKDIHERTRLLAHLREKGISAVYHYVPLHSADAGKKHGVFHGEDQYTTKESERQLRLPLYYGITEAELDYIVRAVYEFYGVPFPSL